MMMLESIQNREDTNMPNIKPVTDLRNYTDVLRDVTVGSPVFLTKNGRGRYAIVDMQDYERTAATMHLMSELERGRRSGEEEGWVTADDVRAHFAAKQANGK
jgi:prevent-host-death family protein